MQGLHEGLYRGSVGTIYRAYKGGMGRRGIIGVIKGYINVVYGLRFIMVHIGVM